MTLANKKILIGITGGIAAYKICELVRMLKKLGADVFVVMTPSAKEFVTETTMMTLSQNPVYSEQFQVDEWKPEHISLADSADLFIIAPASANTIGKIANGICDNLLTSLICAFKKPVVFAPAMNCNMWDNEFVKANINKLIAKGFSMIEPESGFLACGYEGKGRMAPVEAISDKVVEILNEEKFLSGKKVVVTAGGTKEEIDPVRYIGNYSSGKMGIAVADAAYQFGAEVELVSTVKVNKPYKVNLVKSAEEMLLQTNEAFTDADALVMAAAVADYRPKEQAEQKIKKEKSDSLVIELVKNPDILAMMASTKNPEQKVIGFCAESQDLIANAKKKVENKKLDFIVANDISNKEIGFNSDYNEVTLIDKDGSQQIIEKTTKNEIARQILKRIFNG